MLLLLRSVTVAAALAMPLAIANTASAQQGTAATAVTVSSPWARATPGGAKVGAAYLELSAPKGAADTLVSAKSPVAGVVELHTHTHEAGVMKMRRVETIPVAAGTKVALTPGGLHIMLMELQKPLKEGEAIDLTLVFEKAGEVVVKVPVLKVGSPGPAGTAGGGGHGGHGGHGKH